MRFSGQLTELEKMMKKQKKRFRSDEIYSRIMFLPVTVIVVSLFIIAYNFTAGKEMAVFELKAADDARASQRSLYESGEPETANKQSTINETANENTIDINSATMEQLDSLPGIGEEKAKAIIKLREEMGGFLSVEDILNVDGIGEKTFEKLRPMICVK